MGSRGCLLIFGAIFLSGISAQDPCPKFCNCTSQGINAGIARCSLLEPSLQRFSPEIAQVVVENLKQEDSIVLTDDFFVELYLENIQTIKIVNSSLKVIEGNAFHNMHTLSDVDLSDNNLVHIPPDTFKNNPELRRLKLTGNPLEFVNNKTKYFLHSASLTDIDLSYCGLQHLTPFTFSQLRNLEVIILSQNKITELNPDALRNVEFLTDLDLSYNNLSHIDPSTFVDNEELYTLALTGNPFRSIDELNIPELNELDISHCQVKSLSASSLEGVPQVRKLNVSYNLIEKIDTDAFSPLEHLTYVYLGGNKLKGPLPEFLFENNKKLEVMSFTNNVELKKLNGFRGNFGALYYYDISNCGLIEISNLTFTGMPTLATLNVSGNSLTHLDVKTFSKLRKLTVLDLSNNQLRFIPSKVFTSNTNLQKLYLSKNQFHHIPPTLFLNTPKLYSLDVSDNHLGYLWNITESKTLKEKEVLKNLIFLNAAGNKIKRLHLYNFVSLRKLVQLDISRNPLECTHDFGPVIEWLIRHRVLPNKGRNPHPVSMSDEILLSNNIQWDELVKQVCPTSFSLGKSKEALKEMLTSQPVTNGPKPIPEDIETNNWIDSERQLMSNNIRSEHFYLGVEKERYILPMMLFVILAIILIIGNIAFIYLNKPRRNYRLVSYKSQFPNPLGGLAQVRHGNSPIYHKLYEDCSVPNTPIVKKNSAKSVVTCLVNNISKGNSDSV